MMISFCEGGLEELERLLGLRGSFKTDTSWSDVVAAMSSASLQKGEWLIPDNGFSNERGKAQEWRNSRVSWAV